MAAQRREKTATIRPNDDHCGRVAPAISLRDGDIK
jgi:hypothetical protein